MNCAHLQQLNYHAPLKRPMCPRLRTRTHAPTLPIALTLHVRGTHQAGTKTQKTNPSRTSNLNNRQRVWVKVSKIDNLKVNSRTSIGYILTKVSYGSTGDF